MLFLSAMMSPTFSSSSQFMNFDPFNDSEPILLRPLLSMSGDQAHSREVSETAYASAAEPRELVWISGAGHVDLYDRCGPHPVRQDDQCLPYQPRLVPVPGCCCWG